LEEQQKDLDRLQALDAELTEECDGMDADITKVLKPRHKSVRVAVPKMRVEVLAEDENIKVEENMSEVTPGGLEAFSESMAEDEQGDATPKLTGAASERYQKAKIRMLTQQAEESKSIRKKLMDQTADLQRQLKFEREEKKKFVKRIQLLETDNRRQNNMKATSSKNEPDVNLMEQDIALLKKDLATAERIAKSADGDKKARDLQLKRASETINKLKAQLTTAQAASKDTSVTDQDRMEALESRNKVLEKQRNDLVEAFKKQMKLIDVLKRQKVHIEAARLLNFTETEFMKTLDWAV
jgi:hypothetical protein